MTLFGIYYTLGHNFREFSFDELQKSLYGDFK